MPKTKTKTTHTGSLCDLFAELSISSMKLTLLESHMHSAWHLYDQDKVPALSIVESMKRYMAERARNDTSWRAVIEYIGACDGKPDEVRAAFESLRDYAVKRREWPQ